MIIFRQYGNTVEITKTDKEPSSKGRLSSTRQRGLVKVRRSDSVRRTKRICLRKLLSAFEEFGSPLLITLTFNGSASDILFSSKCVSNFLRRLRIKFPSSQILIVPELSPAGRIHFHGLLFNVSQDWGDLKKGRYTVSIGRERKERLFAKLWGYGFVDIKKTDGSVRLASYIAKYVAKGVVEPFLSPLRLIRTSIGFPEHLEVRGELASVLYEKYNKHQPKYSSSFYTPFLGNIEKKFFNRLI